MIPYGVFEWLLLLMLVVGHIVIAASVLWATLRAAASRQWFAPLLVAVDVCVVVPATIGGLLAIGAVAR